MSDDDATLPKSPKSPTDRLVDNFQASSMPPVRADGSLELTPAPTDPVPTGPQTLCALGPCTHYHVLTSEMDAQQPLDGSKRRLPVIETRVCYPAPGIEIDLSHAVHSCNRWLPQSADHFAEVRDRFRHLNPESYAAFEASWQQGDPS